MKMNTRARYSLRLMCDIHEHGGKAPVSLGDAAKRQEISKRYLEQIVIPLKKASLIEGVPGKRGGYKLTRPASEINLLEIIEAADAPLCILECLEHVKNCHRAPKCRTRQVWREINSSIIEILSKYKLSDLCPPAPPKNVPGAGRKKS